RTSSRRAGAVRTTPRKFCLGPQTRTRRSTSADSWDLPDAGAVTSRSWRERRSASPQATKMPFRAGDQNSITLARTPKYGGRELALRRASALLHNVAILFDAD